MQIAHNGLPLSGPSLWREKRSAEMLRRRRIKDSPMTTISKLDAAVHQLNLAITLFLAGD